jgi:MFS family permease
MHAPAPAALAPEVRRAVLGLGVTQIIGWGTTYYLLSLLVGKISDDLDLSSAWVLGGTSLTLASAAIIGPAIGRWQDRVGSPIVMSAGSAIMAAGLALLALSKSIATYYLGWLVISIGAPMALYSAAFTALTQIAGPQARRAISLLTFMGGLASTIFWPLTGALMEIMGWRQIVFLFAGINLVICLPIHLMLLGDHAELTKTRTNAQIVEPGVPPAAQMPAFLLLAAMLALNGLIFNTWSLLVFSVLSGIGFVGASAVFVGSLVGIFQVGGRMGEFMLGASYSAMWTAMVSAVFLPLAFAILPFSNGATSVGVVFAAFYGISNGLLTIARGALTLAIFGTRGYGERLNRVTVAQNAAGAIAPILGGVLLDNLGAPILLRLMLACSLVSLAIFLALRIHCARNGLN